MKKILIIVPALGTGGGEKLAIDLALHINKKEYDVAILSLYSKNGMLLEDIAEKSGIKILYLNKKLGFDIYTFIDAFRCIKKYKPDVIHTHLYVVPYILPATILCRIKKRYHTVHSIASEEAKGSLKKIMHLSYKLCGFRPVAICDYVKKTICDEYKLELDFVSCIYNGVDTKIFYKNKDVIKSSNLIYLVTTGRMQKVKNHKLLIEAFSEVCQRHDNVRLTILGDGELRSDIENQITDFGIQNKVTLKGVVKNVAEELIKSNIYVMTSNYEGLPLSVLEAMSCGLPIITTKAGGVIDIVKNNENGFLIDIGHKQQLVEAISKLLDNENLRYRFGEKSYVMAKKYDIRECVTQYEELYNK